MRLLEVFRDFEVLVEGRGQFGRYRQLFKIEPRKERRRITEEDLRRYVRRLQEKYPNEGFRLRKWKGLWVIDKPSYRVERGKKVRDWRRIPIYIDLSAQRFFVPAWYVKKKRKLTNYVVMRTLGTLGISRSRYVGTIGRS